MNKPNPELIKDFSEARKLTGEKKYHESIKKYEIILEKGQLFFLMEIFFPYASYLR